MQQQGGSQYGLPPSEMAPFSPFTVRPRAHLLGIPCPDHLQQPPLAEAASPISSRPPAASTPRPPAMNFDELAPAVASGNFPDDEALAAGEEAERGSGATGNRWPRQETLALLKIRSVMDAAFREATLKGPLWEEVSRKLAELGYKRSAKKCKEKFENVHKYYKRTKEGRAGRQDGKSYRFFSQLEALHSGSAATATTAAALVASSSSLNPGMAGPPPSRVQPISAVAPQTMAMPTRVVVPELTPPGGPQGISSSAACGISFSSKSSSSSSEADDEVTEEAGERQEGRKRKISGGDLGTSRKMMAFFDRLMKQVVERQEAMQQRFLEAIEKREQDRMIRDEAWRRQEMARLNREQELLAQERAIALSRDAAIISYLQKISGQTIPIPAMPATPIATSPLPQQQPPHAPPPPPPAAQQQPQPPPPQQQKPPASAQPTPQQHEVQKHHQSTEIVPHQPSSGSTELVPGSEPLDAGGSASLQEPMSSSSRWPKSEVHALIKLRSELESKFQEIGPKGLLWEEISAGMQRLGYSRSAKRCKEKWENINKYFKKVKESNRKRPEDSKTCPYFAQLDALYRNKLIGAGAGGGSSSGSGSTVGIQRQLGQETNPASSQQQSDVLTIMSPPPPVQQQPATEAESKNGKSSSENNRNGGNSEDGGVSGSTQVQTSNGGLSPSFFDVGLKKPEDIVKELMDEAVTDDYDKLDEAESDNMDQDDEDEDDDDEEAGKMQYKIQIQSQNVNAGGSGGNSSAAAATAGSFFAIVQ